MNSAQIVLQQTNQNVGENLYIGRYSKHKISADNIGQSIYRLVSYTKIQNFMALCRYTTWLKLV